MKEISDVGIELIGSGVTLIIAFLWQKGVVPFFENILYKGIRIDGKWTIDQVSLTADAINLSTCRNVVLFVKQKATKIYGTATSTYSDGSDIKDCIFYDLSGEVKDRFVTVFLKCSEKNRMAYSTLLLEIVSDGSIMYGYRNFYGLKRQKIDATSCKLRKL